MDLKNGFCTTFAKKILGNQNNATEFLLKLQEEKKFDLPFKTISRGKNKGEKILNLDTKELWNKIVIYWNFEIAEKIIRELFIKTPKYKSGKNSYNIMKILISEWEKLALGKIKWPFSQGDFDSFVQSVNAQTATGYEKDEKVKLAAVQYRRIKEINTVRNDFIETLIFEKNKNILPTLNHRRAVDFFINGNSFDQKVAKSPTEEFKKKYDTNWKEFAIKNPPIVAEYLYKYQSEERFAADSRLLVVYLDEDISIERIAETIENVNLEMPLEINFTYS